MPLGDLSDDEIRILGECLRAAAKGPFIPDEEFHTLFGLERADVARIMERWPAVDESDEDVTLAINNAVNNLLGYPHRQQAVWGDFISVSPEGLYKLWAKWRGAGPANHYEGMM